MIIVKGAIENLKVLTEDPMIILFSKKEYFGSPLPKKVIVPTNFPRKWTFISKKMTAACLKGTAEVFSRQ